MPGAVMWKSLSSKEKKTLDFLLRQVNFFLANNVAVFWGHVAVAWTFFLVCVICANGWLQLLHLMSKTCAQLICWNCWLCLLCVWVLVIKLVGGVWEDFILVCDCLVSHVCQDNNIFLFLHSRICECGNRTKYSLSTTLEKVRLRSWNWANMCSCRWAHKHTIGGWVSWDFEACLFPKRIQ